MSFNAQAHRFLRSASGILLPQRVRLAIAAWYAREISDAIVISFPKCGRTWLRVMLGGYFRSHFGLSERELIEIHRLGWDDRRVPKITFSHDDLPHLKMAEELERSKGWYRRSNVILLARDPRDVVVSMYFHKRFRTKTISGTLSEYLRGRRGSIESTVMFYNNWLAQRRVPRSFLVTRYEDFHVAPEYELRRVLSFVGISAVSPEYVAQAIAAARFDRMRAMEISGELDSERLHAGLETEPEALKTREGVVGGYRRYLSSEEIEEANRYIDRHLDPQLGYHSSKIASDPPYLSQLSNER